MPPQESLIPTTCDHCGKPFETSRQHPRRYCSISCEEGRGPLPDRDPQSPNYHAYLQGNPGELVGRALIARGLKFCNYSPDWHRHPSDYASGVIINHNEEAEEFVRADDVYLGTVTEHVDGEYIIKRENLETGETFTRSIDTSDALMMIRRGNWWAE